MGLNQSHELLSDCAFCPRQCHADRVAGRAGWCGAGAGFNIGSICLHRGEEPVISGPNGICNVFFTRCNLACRYCQNHQISARRGPVDEENLTLDETVRRIRRLLNFGARAVGFVSPSHCMPQMLELMDALEKPVRPVFVFNSNGYDLVEQLKPLEGRMDVYLPDLKYMDAELAGRLSGAPDYPKVAGAALKEMYRQKGSRLWLTDGGIAESGLIIRHLVLPGQVENSKACLRFIAEELSPSVYLSLLAQYHPTPAVASDPELGRALRREEYEEVLDEMDKLGFYRGYTQQLSSAENYNPDFQNEHPFE